MQHVNLQQSPEQILSSRDEKNIEHDELEKTVQIMSSQYLDIKEQEIHNRQESSNPHMDEPYDQTSFTENNKQQQKYNERSITGFQETPTEGLVECVNNEIEPKKQINVEMPENDQKKFYETPKRVHKKSEDIQQRSNSFEERREINQEKIVEEQKKSAEQPKKRKPQEPRNFAFRHSMVSDTALQSLDIFKGFGNPIFERQSQRFMFIRNWEDRRVQKCSIFNKIIQNLSKSVITQFQELHKNIEFLLKFLRDRVNHEAQYSSISHLAQPALSFASTQPVNSFLNFNQCMCSLQDAHIEISKQIDRLASHIETVTIKNIQDETRFLEQKQVQAAQIFKQIRSRCQKLSQTTLDKFQQYSKTFSEIAKAYAKKKASQKDFMVYELNYLNEAKRYFKTIKQFGKMVSLFVQQGFSLEKKRLKLVQSQLSLYLEKYSEVFPNIDLIKELSEKFNSHDFDKELVHFFRIDSLVPQEEFVYLKQTLKISQISFEHVSSFIEQFTLPPIPDIPLVTKTYKAEIELQLKQENGFKVKGNQMHWKQCNLCISMDNNLLVLENSNQDIFENDILQIISMQQCSCEYKEDISVITLKETKQGLLFDTKNYYSLQLFQPIHIGQFINFIQPPQPRKTI